MDSIVSWFSANWVNIAAIYGGVVAIATVIVKFTPSQKDDAVLAKIVDVVSYFSHVDVKNPEVKTPDAEAVTEKLVKYVFGIARIPTIKGSA